MIKSKRHNFKYKEYSHFFENVQKYRQSKLSRVVCIFLVGFNNFFRKIHYKVKTPYSKSVLKSIEKI